MNNVRNKGCFADSSRALLASEFLLIRLLSTIPALFCPLKKWEWWVNVVIVIVLSVFELKMRLLLTCKYFTLNWAK